MSSVRPFHLIVVTMAVALLALAIWACLTTIRSRRENAYGKAVWCLVLLVLPVLGLGLWFMAFFPHRHIDRAQARR